MKDKQWKLMSTKDRAEYLLTGDFLVKKHHGIPANSKVGDITIITVYEASSGGVVVSERCNTLVECLENAVLNLKKWEEDK